MRTNHCHGNRLRSKRRLIRGRVPRRGGIIRFGVLSVIPMIFILVGGIFATDLSEGPILVNPLEKQFDTTSKGPDSSKGLAKRSRFSDQSFPSGKNRQADIRQASAQETSGGIWDRPFEETGVGSGFTGWGDYSPSPALSSGVGAAPDVWAHSNGPTAANPFGGYNTGGYNTMGTSPRFSQGTGVMFPSSAHSGANTYSNTGSDSNASPSADSTSNSMPNLFGMNGWNAPAPTGGIDGTGSYGYGFYNPGIGRLDVDPYGLSYGAGMNPYGINGMTPPYGMNPMYGGGFGMYDPNGYYGAMGGGMQNPAMLQSWLQQEMLRHRRSLEEEDEKERRQAEEEAKSSWSMKQLMPVHVTSPLGKTLLSCVRTVSPFTSPTGPDRGVGMPLATRSWLDRPYYVGGFVGSTWGSQLVAGLIDQEDGAAGGLNLGYYLNDYWGLEGRLHFASIDIFETAEGEQSNADWYRANNPGATFIPPMTTRTNQLTVFDVSVHYYPLGNAKFRPFFKWGLGVTRESFTDTFYQKRNEDSIAMPIGIGLRYWWNERIAIQADFVDNIVFSSGITKTQNNWALSVGITYAFGTSKKRRPVPYWPYTPSTGTKW